MLACQVGEVNDELVALGLRDEERGDWHRTLEKAPLGGNDRQRIARAEREAVLTGIGPIKDTEAITARLDPQERLLRSIDDNGVAEDAIVAVKRVEDGEEERAIGVEAAILQHEGDVEAAGGQAEPCLAGVVGQ